VLTPLPVANVMLIFASTCLAISIGIGSAFLTFYSLIALILAGQLVGAAKKAGR
jgi:hypothetical protein